jgi:hypothetical protein
MSHLSEEQLILHYYGEADSDSGGAGGAALAAEVHLEDCAECRAAYAALQRVLNVVDGLAVPVRAPDYGTQVWERVSSRIPGRRRLRWPAPLRWAAAGAVMAGLLVVAFVAGRFYPQPRKAGPMAVAADPRAGERILLVAVGDYLERSQMILVELQNANAREPLDISSEQERAADLVGESRLYRQTAERTGDTRVAGVLDDLDRVLLEIAHAPSRLAPEDLERLRHRLEADGILFKIRVLGSNVRSQGEEPASAGRKL